VWDTETLNGIEPGTGRVFWSVPFKTKLGHTIGTPRRQGDYLFVSTFFDGSKLLRLDPDRPVATEIWSIRGPNESRPEGLHSLMSTPFLEDGYIYGVCSYGQLRCLKLATGERVWETLAATTANGKPTRWATAFLVKNQNRFFLYNEKGDLIIARLSPAGYEEISRAHLLDPTNNAGGRAVHWSHPAFANRCGYLRNDREIICVDLGAKTGPPDRSGR
jgi:outer membrane protein assembly factor BamB